MIGGCGTARVRKTAFPPYLHDDRSSIPWNELSGGPAGSAGKVLAVQWQDQSAVHFLTTIHNLEDRITVSRKRPRLSSCNGPAIRKAFGSMERANVPIPVITNDYNRHKVGVDVADQYRSYYFTQLKCLRNWPPIFYWLLDTTAINAYLLSQRISVYCRPPSGSRPFRTAIAENLISQYARMNTAHPRKSYYTRKTSSPRYSKLQQRTTLPPPTPSPSGDSQSPGHQYIHFASKRLECTQCRFILRAMNRKGKRAPTTHFGCRGPGCGFSLCRNCYNICHKDINVS